MAPHDLVGGCFSREAYNYHFREPAEDVGSMVTLMTIYSIAQWHTQDFFWGVQQI
jgi:hypothetical protein